MAHKIMKTFIGRKEELKQLRELQKRRSASLVIIRGRRRIGKTRLVEEFAKGQRYYLFTGIAPSKKTNAQTQRDEFARQLSEQFRFPGLKAQDWGDLFTLLAREVVKERIVILFDEISWMGSKDPTFLGKLKNTWDSQFSKNPKLMLILCGSVSAWIEKNIISSTAFLGRPSFYMTLEELKLEDCNLFWGDHPTISAFEKLKVLSVTGGVPRYLELIDPRLSAEKNIGRLCFSKGGPLVDEFDYIFSDIFGKRSKLYREIIQQLVSGPKTLDELFKLFGISRTGDFSEYLRELQLAGFVSRDHTWHLKTEKISTLSHYRLRDNYVRFYWKYIYPNKQKIQKGIFEETSVTTLPAWDSVMALQFENLVINHDLKILELLNIPPEELVFSNPFFQRKTITQPGCQIDFLIQTKFNNVYVCEIKFSKHKIGHSIIKEVAEKIEKLKLPKNFSCRPVLICANGAQDEVVNNGFFSEIIYFEQLLKN